MKIQTWQLKVADHHFKKAMKAILGVHAPKDKELFIDHVTLNTDIGKLVVDFRFVDPPDEPDCPDDEEAW